MTKIKNTKKGMAKKTLSMSLVVAMLATSNVPVWAAEFSDGSDASVATEAPAVADTATNEFTDAATETPAVEDTTNAVAATDYTDDSSNINTENYTLKNVKFSTGAWDSKIKVSGSITDKYGNEVDDLCYTWLADGVQADGNGAASTAEDKKVSEIEYTPTKEDFNKTLSLVVYEKGAAGVTVFSQTISGDTVKAKDLSNDSYAAPNFAGMDTTYTGKELKLKPANAGVFKFSSYGITADQIVWNYTTDGNDFINVTGKDITVVGTLEGTYDINSTAYGYAFTSKSATYQISKKTLTSSNVEIEFKKTAIPFTNGTYEFGKNDITLSVVMDDKSKVDITNALKNDVTFTGSANEVKKGNTISVKDVTVRSGFDTTTEAEKVLQNYNTGSLNSGKNIGCANTYEVTVLNLETCTGEVTTEYLVDDFRKNPTVSSDDILLTTADGVKFKASQLGTNINVAVNQTAIDAAKNGVTGVVQNAVTISFKADTRNVTGSISLPINLTTLSLSNATVTAYSKTLNTTKTAGAYNYMPTYNGEAQDLTKASDFAVSIGGKALQTGEYEVSYDDNVNAGIVTVTITGKGSYAGSTKKVYFRIVKATVADKSLTVEKRTTVNSDNNYDASLYKDALKAKIETTLNNKKVTLEEGKDYTVKYYFATTKNLTSEAAIKAAKGKNVVGNYIYAVATPVENGNYTFTGTDWKLVAGSEIVAKSISGVSITLDKDSYTFTGKEIVPTITVKDGSTVLEKGVDYTVTVKDGLDVGKATVTIKATTASGYDPESTATTTFDIVAAKAENVKVNFNESEFKYTGKQIKPTIKDITLNGVNVTKYFDVTYPTYGENVNAGKETGSVTVAPIKTTANFTGTKTQLFDIKGKTLAGNLKLYYNDKTQVSVQNYVAKNKITGTAYNFYYDGSEQKFASEVFTATTKGNIVAGTDYEIKYINNVDAGYGFAVVTAKGNYEGNLSINSVNYWLRDYAKNDYYLKDGKLTKISLAGETTVLATNVVNIVAFGIQPTIVTAKNITVSNGIYAGGLAVKPEVTVTVGGKTLVEGTDYDLVIPPHYSLTADKFTDVTTGKPYYVYVNLKGGYKFDEVNGTNMYMWGIDKKALKACSVSVDKNLKATVTNGNVIEEKENFTVKDNGDGTATVSVVDGGKNYTGSVNVEIGGRKVGAPMISNVKVVGNKATVVLSDEVDGASGYDYVISTDKDCIKNKNYAAVNKNQAKTSTAFKYVDQGTYYAYCHAWTRDANGKKVFGEWSNGFQFSVTATTPDAPVIKSVKVSGSTVKVTYELSANATGYDVVLGTSSKKDNGELRPYNYGAHKVLNLKESTVTATFKNVPAGTWTVGMHAFNRTSLDGKKVFSPWSNLKTAKVK